MCMKNFIAKVWSILMLCFFNYKMNPDALHCNMKVLYQSCIEMVHSTSGVSHFAVLLEISPHMYSR